MYNKSWSTESIIPPLKNRLKRVLAPAARQALPTVTRVAGIKGNATGSKAVSQNGFIHGYRSLESLFPEANSKGNGTGSTPPTKAAVERKVQAANRVKARGEHVDQLAKGGALGSSLVDTARQLIKNGERSKAISIGHSLRARTESRDIGTAVLGMAILDSSGPVNSWDIFSEIANSAASEAVASELYAAAFGTLGAKTSSILEADLAAGRVDRWDQTALLRVAQKALAHGLYDHTKSLLEIADKLPDASRSKHVSSELSRLATWLPGGKRRAAIPTVPGAINYGIMSYEQPDVTSRNIGDYIQTVASMGHVVRHQNFSFVGDSDLVGVAEELRATTKTERLVDGPAATLNLLELNRDGSPYQQLPEQTWALTFGWYMHQTFNQGYGIPFHPNLRPILMSIFVRHPDMLTEEAIAYLRQYAPVGCRDWQTVATLRAVGVPAFFSGCLTTTIDTVFRRDGEDDRNATIYVDAPQTGPGETRTQAQTGIRSLTFAENLRLARDWVSHYHLEYNNVVTSRLHCFLPARSVGSKVTFLPKNRSDNRFGGLIDTTDADFDRIRQGILDKASVMLQAVAEGKTQEEIYALWREICAPAMAEADERMASVEMPTADKSVLQNAVSVSSSRGTNHGDEGHVNVLVDVRAGEGKRLAPLVRSLHAHSDAPLTFWFTGDTVSAAERRTLEELNLPVGINWFDARSSKLQALRGAQPQVLNHEIVLALALDALKGISTAIMVPAAGLVRSDIAGLLAQKPGKGQFLSARNDLHRGHSGGIEAIRRVATRQGADNKRALDLIFASHAQIDGNYRPFDPNVMVLDLDFLRKEDFGARLVGLTREYSMTFREGLNTLVGPARSTLDRQWNHAPAYEEQEDPSIVNWRDSTKPWSDQYTPFSGEFNQAGQ